MSSSPARARTLVAVALLVGFVLRAGFALVYWQGKPLTHDEQEYLAHALNLAAGRGFTRELPGALEGASVEEFSRAPLYPALLAGLFRLTGESTDSLPLSVPQSVQLAQAIMGVAGVWIVSRLARRAGGPRAGVIAAWLAAVYPPLVWICAYALSEAVYSPLILGSAFLMGTVLDRRDDTRREGDGHRVFLASVLAGLAALVRSAGLAWIPLVAAWLAWRRRPALGIVCLLGGALAIAPWTLRNVATHGRLVLIAADGGVNFWTGNHPLAIGEGDMAANPQIKAAHVTFRAQLAGLSPEEREPHYYHAAFRFVREHPGQWVLLLGKKFFYTWIPLGPSYRLHSSLYYWATMVSYVPLLIVAGLGLPRLARAPSRPVALGLLVLSSVVIGIVFFPHERFRIPVVDPALCVAASTWLAGVAKRG